MGRQSDYTIKEDKKEISLEDINDSKEKNLFDQIKRIIQINYLRTKVSAKDLAQIYRIAEHALKAKKNEIAEDLDWIKKRSVKPQE